jgi:ferritin-like metal-binding protein YciE
MTIASSTDIFFDQLRDLKSATEQAHATLPDLKSWASEPALKKLFQEYEAATVGHFSSILAIFDDHGKDPGHDVCLAMEGLIEGGNKHLQMAADAAARDHLLIAHSNRIGHYLTAAAEFTLAIAKSGGFPAEAKAIGSILVGERAFTKTLAEVAAQEWGMELGGET